MVCYWGAEGLRRFDWPSPCSALQRVLLQLHSGDKLGGLFLSPPKKRRAAMIAVVRILSIIHLQRLQTCMSVENTLGIKI